MNRNSLPPPDADPCVYGHHDFHGNECSRCGEQRESTGGSLDCHLCHSTGRITDGYQHHGEPCECQVQPCDAADCPAYCWNLTPRTARCTPVWMPRVVINTTGVCLSEVA